MGRERAHDVAVYGVGEQHLISGRQQQTGISHDLRKRMAETTEGHRFSII